MKLHILVAALAGALFIGVGAADALEQESAPTAWQSHEVQRGIKRANEGVVALGIFQIVITGLGTFGVLWSLQMSRAALYQARVSAEIQRDVAREELRGYLSAETPFVERFDSSGLRVNYLLRNVGRTPVKNVRMWSYVKVVKGNSDWYRIPDEILFESETPRVVPPGGVVGMAADKFFAKVEEFDEIKENKATLLTAYMFSYEDIFGHERFVGYSEVRRGPALSYRTMNEAFIASIAQQAAVLPPVPESLHETPRVGRECPLAWFFKLVGART